MRENTTTRSVIDEKTSKLARLARADVDMTFASRENYIKPNALPWTVFVGGRSAGWVGRDLEEALDNAIATIEIEALPEN